MNTTTPDERSEKDGLAREPRELSSEELESIIGGVEVGLGIGSGMEEVKIFGLNNIDEEVERLRSAANFNLERLRSAANFAIRSLSLEELEEQLR